MVDSKSRQGQAGGGATERTGHAAHSHSITDVQARQPAYGEIIGRAWRKRLCASRHMLRKPPAWAVDCDDLARAEACGAELVFIEDCETGWQYMAALSVIREYGFLLDRGFGQQIALPLARWHRFSPDTAPALQLRLFGEVGL